MNSFEIAPGTILQQTYLRKRINGLKNKPLSFLDIGAGTGIFSNILLELGLEGIGIDLNTSSCDRNNKHNQKYVDSNKYSVVNQDYFEIEIHSKFDIIFSSMVIEHLPNNKVDDYFAKAISLLKPNGRIITLVPAQMKYWGIEDEIAGHFKRYTRNCFHEIAKKNNLEVAQLAGLTYPLSNLLLQLSNKIITKNESQKANFTMESKTIQSSNRQVYLKTEFPKYYKMVLNPIVLYPFHLLQTAFRNSDKSMILYCEFTVR
ncbi:class I SAM-dependent methyltransferase [Cryomorpha ignava]|uniref:Class I SAM-dependent methyltransferase n=1 Tax=Cryomorpha ignava TaxID=101383 RepID=A0A7K3WP21_9FLAO|nr:class I SAM-dependent methyltransferase [Cryomorpha ignava]NEN23409.1 class I SAM-dependent methyltransferase [Cryomorpha ignava]